jgi:ubiquinone/menaquinone biosynthesis C-methylase UbiE
MKVSSTNIDKLTKSRYEVYLELLKNETKKGSKIINLGDTNSGVLTQLLRERGYNVTTVDLYDADIKCDLNKKIPVPSESFDIAIAGEVIEHLYRTRTFLSEVYRILKPNGIFIISIPNIACLKNRIKLLFGMLPTYCAHAEDFEIEHGIPGHVRDFNLSLVKKLLKETGFKIESVKTNGIFIKMKKIIPGGICPPSLGDILIVKVRKI